MRHDGAMTDDAMTDDDLLTVHGGAPLRGTIVRGGFSHLIAALAAEGTSRVRGIGLIDRGYEHFQHKLDSLGANYER